MVEKLRAEQHALDNPSSVKSGTKFENKEEKKIDKATKKDDPSFHKYDQFKATFMGGSVIPNDA